MMDPINLADTAVALQDQILQLVLTYKSNIGPELKDLDLYLGELDILGSVMTECVAVLSSASSPAPDSVGKALRQCQNIATMLQFDLSKILSRKIRYGVRRDQLEISDFQTQELSSILSHIHSIRGTVLLLRQVVTDFQTQQSLHSLASAQRSSTQKLSANAPHIHTAYINVGTETRSESRAVRPRLDEPVEALEIEELPDLTVFNGLIAFVKTPRMENAAERATVPDRATGPALPETAWVAVRGKYDTGSGGDLISIDVLRRAGVLDLVITIEPQTFSALKGTRFVFDKVIDLSWSPYNSWCLFAGRFFVLDDVHCEFDMLIGASTIRKHNAINANQSLILPLSLRRKTKAQELEERRKAEEQRKRTRMEMEELAAAERVQRRNAAEAYHKSPSGSAVDQIRTAVDEQSELPEVTGAA